MGINIDFSGYITIYNGIQYITLRSREALANRLQYHLQPRAYCLPRQLTLTSMKHRKRRKTLKGEQKKRSPNTTIMSTDHTHKPPSHQTPIEIDGSYKEGGGQIIRNSITYAVLLQKSITISKIRANRPRGGGLRPQHLSGLKLAVEIGNSCFGAEDAELVGAEVGAKTVTYHCITENTRAAKEGGDAVVEQPITTFVADTGTAGSIALLLQASFLPGVIKAFRSTCPNVQSNKPAVQIELCGGTNATGAPQIDYITDVFAPFINSYFSQQHHGGTTTITHQSSNESLLDIQIVKRGYFPKGGGIVHINLKPPSSIDRTKPVIYPPIRLTKCQPIASIQIKAFHAGNCPRYVANKMVNGAVNGLKQAWNENKTFRKRFFNAEGVAISDNITVQITHETNCLGSGSGILVVAYPTKHDTQTLTLLCPALAASGLGDRKVKPAQTGIDAAKELIECIASGGCVDRWLQDQLIPFMALADSSEQSEILVGELTLHSQTAMRMAEIMTGCKFEVERSDCGDDCGDNAGRDDLVNSIQYGENGRTLGRHVIRCQGIGFSFIA